MNKNLTLKLSIIVLLAMVVAMTSGKATTADKLRVGVVGLDYKGGKIAKLEAAAFQNHIVAELGHNDKVTVVALDAKDFKKIKEGIITDGALVPKEIRDKTDAIVVAGVWIKGRMLTVTIEFIKSDTGAIIKTVKVHEKKDTSIYIDIDKTVAEGIAKLMSAPIENIPPTVETPKNTVLHARGVGVMPIQGNNPLMSKRGAYVLALRDAAERGLGATVELATSPEAARRQVIAKLETSLTNIVMTLDERQGDVWVTEIEADVVIPPEIVKQFPELSPPESTGFKPAIQTFKQGSINWETGVITARGKGRIAGMDAKSIELAKRAARVNSYATAMEMIEGINFDPDAVVLEQIAMTPQRTYRIRALVQGAEVVAEKKLDDTTFEVTIQIPMRGVKGITTVFDDLFKWQPITPPIIPDDPEPAEDEKGVTGLIIDTRGMGAMPAIAPVVTDESGTVVYGVGGLSPEVMKQRGGAAYVTGEPTGPSGAFLGPNPLRIGVVSVEPIMVADNSRFPFAFTPPLRFLDPMMIVQATAKVVVRQGTKPVTVKAKNAAGQKKAKVVVANADAQKIKRTNKKPNYLAEGRVVIITDSMVGATEGRAPVWPARNRFAMTR